MMSYMFCFTGKRGGYDCMRHYEIVASKSLPVFIDYSLVPSSIMTTWPRQLQLEANSLYCEMVLINNNSDKIMNRYVKLLDEKSKRIAIKGILKSLNIENGEDVLIKEFFCFFYNRCRWFMNHPFCNISHNTRIQE